MSKHNHAKERQTQVTPPSREGAMARPRASGVSEPSPPAVMGGPAARTRSAGKPAPTHEQCALRAYELWEALGRPEGADRENWFEAERQLRAELE